MQTEEFVYDHFEEKIIPKLFSYKETIFSKNTTGVNLLTELLVCYLIEYFSRLGIKYEDRPLFSHLPTGDYLPDMLLRAAMLLDFSNEEWIKKYRDKYEKLNISKKYSTTSMSSGLFAEQHNTAVVPVARRLAMIMEQAMPTNYINYGLLDGVWLALRVYFNKFIEEVYVGKGMYEAIRDAEKRGVGGSFGETKLLTYYICDRIKFQFSRESESVSFSISANDSLAMNSGLTSCNTDLITALTMIEDVIKNYDPARFKENENISII